MTRLKKLLFSRLLLCWWFIGIGFTPALSADSAPTLVIIIDDIGNNMASGMRAVELPGKLTLAILPHTPASTALAQMAATNGKEVMLHAPMSNLHHKALGPGALTDQMSESEIRQALIHNIESTPHIRGVSNHMGSQLTSMRAPMEWLMQELGSRQLYFVDSRTTVHTLAAAVAREQGVPHLSRQVFLDNKPSREAIHKQFTLLLKQADSQGLAVAIGHPYPETLDYLQEALPALAAGGYRLALISEVLSPEYQLTRRAPP
jgi:uncharacterized protein